MQRKRPVLLDFQGCRRTAPWRPHFQNIKQRPLRQFPRQKIAKILSTKSRRFEKGEPPMRIKHAILIGIVAALASAPALARNSDASNFDVQPTNEPPASSSCSALQKMADGTWARVPCQEVGSPQQGQRKSAARNSEQQTR
jgi:hypothetical protein